MATTLTDKPFRVAVCGCNDLIFNKELGENSLYYDLAKRAKDKELDLIVHNGDQVYVDHKEKKDKNGKSDHTNIYNDCLDIIKEKPKEDWGLYEEEIVSKMKNLYRKTWSGKTAELMANCSNLMQYDDHEIHNNFGYETKYSDSNNPNSFIVKCSRRCYYEYQRQLREDVDFITFNDVTEDYFSLELNGVGLYFLDHRGPRSWYKTNDDEYKHLGSKQINDLRNCLETTFKSCPIVLIFSSNPLVIHNEEVSKKEDEIEEFLFNDSEGYGKFLKMLAEHKLNAKQELYLFGGDLHIGGHTEVYKDGKAIFKQLVTSGVGQRTKDSMIKYFEGVLGQTNTNLPGGFSFKHHDWTYNRNYATLEVKLSNNVPIFSSYLTISDKDMPKEKKNVITNEHYSLDDKYDINEYKITRGNLK